MELAWTLKRNDDSVAKQALGTMDTAGPQKQRIIKEHLEKRSEERNMDSRFQVQLEEDGGSCTRQSWMDTSSLWPMIHWERQGLSQVSQVPISMLHREQQGLSQVSQVPSNRMKRAHSRFL